MSNNKFIITITRWDRLCLTWQGIGIACAEFGVSRFDPRIAWATVCAMWSAL